MSHYLGIDLGGTNVKAGITDSQGKILAQISVPTGKSGKDLAAGRVIERMVEASNQVIEQAGVRPAAVGVLSPGQASLSKGIVLRSANLPLWRNVHLRAKVSEALKLPAVLENDAHAAAYAEWWAGVGKGKNVDSLFIFTLGTGVGGGLIYHGKVVHGSFDFATEIGHSIMVPGPDGEKCGCGQTGCLERYASARYTAERAMRLLGESKKLRKKSTLGKLYKRNGTINTVDIQNHAKAGDAFADSVWDESCRILALACINVCHFIDPRMIVIGGGMSKAGNFLLQRVQKHFKAHWWKMTKPNVKIILARLGNDAGIIGAAGVAKHASEHNGLPAIGS